MATERVTTLDTIRELQKKDPFLPFWIVMSSGQRYVIENPDGLAVGSSQLHYYPPKSDRGVHMQISEITAVEELEVKRAG